MQERTLAIIKPDAVQRRLAGQIMQRIRDAGFQIRAIQRLHLSKSQAEGFYAVHRQRPFFGSFYFAREGTLSTDDHFWILGRLDDVIKVAIVSIVVLRSRQRSDMVSAGGTRCNLGIPYQPSGKAVSPDTALLGAQQADGMPLGRLLLSPMPHARVCRVPLLSVA